MRRTILLAALCAVLHPLPLLADEPALIPRPQSLHMSEDGTHYTLKQGAYVFVPMMERELYLETLSSAARLQVRMAPADVSCAIQFLSPDFVPGELTQPEGEGYLIRVLPTTIIVHAATPAGHFNGLQTLAQLLAGAPHSGDGLTLPGMVISDAPRYAWRGYMLDESRHFTGVEPLKRLLDAMAHYKLNRLHWHLTDSPGWRIEIRAYPLLTEVGSRGSETDRSPNAPRQFYTQAQVRELVAYARARNITIVPEIDMPGHADGATSAYPEHSGGGFTREKGNSWPHFTFNPARPETLAFLDDILTEVAALFPEAGVIHFGGDEVHYGWKQWPELPAVEALMAKEGFTELKEVETWFNRRTAATINRLGFVSAGWDEIAGCGLPRDKTLVFWWRHDKPEVLRQVLDDGYPVVMCPRRPCYFDFVQRDAHTQGRRWGGFNPLHDVYAFPESLTNVKPEDDPLIRGIQACLWTETTVTQARRDFMTFPRLLALAEAGWTPRNRKDYASFEQRLKPHLPRLRQRGFSIYDPFADSPEVVR